MGVPKVRRSNWMDREILPSDPFSLRAQVLEMIRKWVEFQSKPHSLLRFYVWKWSGTYVPCFGWISDRVHIHKDIFHNGHGFSFRINGLWIQICHSGRFYWGCKERTLRVSYREIRIGF